jgi:ATP-dependent Lon protease
MEVIRFDGYTVDEKVAIARGYLWPRQRERNGLREDEVDITDELLETIVADYTREAGVRQLERELGTLLRGAATKIAGGEASGAVVLDQEALREALGRQKFFQESVERTAIPGVSTGLAVTGTGGDILFIEATAMDGDKGLVLTGQLVHVHVPAGAIPKDGPSAGVTMVTALTSLLTGQPVRHTVGMTGEVTLQGRVLPIGGLKQKVLAAHAAGLTEVILPERNRGDLDEVPEEVREQMTFHPVMSIDEVLGLALEPAGPRKGHEAVAA